MTEFTHFLLGHGSPIDKVWQVKPNTLKPNEAVLAMISPAETIEEFLKEVGGDLFDILNRCPKELRPAKDVLNAATGAGKATGNVLVISDCERARNVASFFESTRRGYVIAEAAYSSGTLSYGDFILSAPGDNMPILSRQTTVEGFLAELGDGSREELKQYDLRVVLARNVLRRRVSEDIVPDDCYVMVLSSPKKPPEGEGPVFKINFP
jgi:hypothetical protein